MGSNQSYRTTLPITDKANRCDSNPSISETESFSAFNSRTTSRTCNPRGDEHYIYRPDGWRRRCKPRHHRSTLPDTRIRDIFYLCCRQYAIPDSKGARSGVRCSYAVRHEEGKEGRARTGEETLEGGGGRKGRTRAAGEARKTARGE